MIRFHHQQAAYEVSVSSPVLSGLDPVPGVGVLDAPESAPRSPTVHALGVAWKKKYVYNSYPLLDVSTDQCCPHYWAF
jgi:hypothetical protein